MKTSASKTPRVTVANSNIKAIRNRTAATMASIMVSLVSPTAACYQPDYGTAAITPECHCNRNPSSPPPDRVQADNRQR